MSKRRYPLKLRDEVYVTKERLEKLFDKKKVFVLGYGSLLFAHGWRNRGMRNIIKPDHLKECTIHGYERGPFGMINGIHFYGAIENEAAEFNAVVTHIHTLWDWEGLMQTEMIAGMFQHYNYRVVDVTKLVSNVKLPKNAVVHMVANEPYNRRLVSSMSPAPNYYPYVWGGVERERTPEFAKKFLETGGYDYKTYRVFKDNRWM